MPLRGRWLRRGLWGLGVFVLAMCLPTLRDRECGCQEFGKSGWELLVDAASTCRRGMVRQ